MVHAVGRGAAALVLTGAPGSGKTSVLEALTTLLEIDEVAYGAIESEQLAWGSPWLESDQEAALLATVLAWQRDAGRRLFLVGATTETDADLAGLVTATAAERCLVVCLRCPPAVAAARVQAREPDEWPGKPWLVEHARELAATMPDLAGVDLVVDTDGRAAPEVAREIREAMRARGLLGAQ